MPIFSDPFAKKDKEKREATFKDPLRLSCPKIGFFNLTGEATADLVRADQGILGPLFFNSQLSSLDIPLCQVLFLYAKVNEDGGITGSPLRLRDIIREAGAHIAVVANENETGNYFQAIEPENRWTANIVLTINRRGDKFAAFFSKLFQSMLKGNSMLTSWAELAPQIPGEDQPDAPETIMLAQGGHITLDGKEEKVD